MCISNQCIASHTFLILMYVGTSSVYVPRNFEIAPRKLEISNLRNYL